MGGVDGESDAVLDCEDELGRPEVQAEGLDGCAVQPVPSVGQREGSKPGSLPDVLIIEHGVEEVKLLLVDHLSEHFLGEAFDLCFDDWFPQGRGEGREGASWNCCATKFHM